MATSIATFQAILKFCATKNHKKFLRHCNPGNRGIVAISTCLPTKKFQDNPNFLPNVYVFQGIKCTCKNISQNNENYFTSKQ